MYRCHTHAVCTTYTFDAFDYTDEFIDFPKRTVFYRGIPAGVKEVVRDHPMYLSTTEVASHYGEVVGLEFIHGVRLMDVRKMKNLLRLIITGRRTTLSSTAEKALFYLCVSFGLVSYQRQWTLFQEYVQANGDAGDPEMAKLEAGLAAMAATDLTLTPLNPLEPEGVRIAETTIDGHVMCILQELFQEVCDGFIAPRLFSPFHPQSTMHEEIVLWNPKQHVRVVDPREKVTTHALEPLLRGSAVVMCYQDFTRKIRCKEGGGVSWMNRDRYFEDPKKVQTGKRLAKAFAKHASVHFSKPPVFAWVGDC